MRRSPRVFSPEHMKGERWVHLGVGEGKVQLNHWMRARKPQSRLDLWLRVPRLEGLRRENRQETGMGLTFQMWKRSVGSERSCKLFKITQQEFKCKQRLHTLTPGDTGTRLTLKALLPPAGQAFFCLLYCMYVPGSK